MKKVFVAILAVIYLSVTSGICFNMHYCMGKLASVDLLKHSDKCGKCGMKTTGGCCKDEVKIVKLNSSHQLISHEVSIIAPVAIIDNSNFIPESNFFYTSIGSDLKNNSPPGSQDISLCILHGVFRI